MKKQVRSISLILACLMMVMLLASCAGGSTTTVAPTTAGTTKAGATTAATTAGPTTTGAKPSITVYGPSNVESFPSGEDENNNKIVNYIKEKTGYNLKWIIAPKENAREAMNMLMASGNPPDMIYTGDKSVFADYTAQGLLEPVDSYITATNKIKTIVPAETWKAVTYDTKRYSVPVPQNQFSSSGVVIRKDWLEKLGNPALKTLDDYVKVLTMMRDQKLGGADTIPYVAHTNSTGVFEYAYGLGVEYKDEGGKLVSTWISENTRAYLKFAAKLFADKLIDPEFAVNTATSNAIEKMTNGRGGMFTGGWTDVKGLTDAVKTKGTNITYSVIAPPTGIDGKPTYFNLNAPVRVYFLFPVKTKTKQAIAFLDRCIEDDIRLVISYGWEGVDYKKRADGVIEQTAEAEKIRYRIYYNMWDTKEDFLNRVNLKGFADGYFPMAEFCKNDPIMNYAPPIKEVTEYSTALKDLKNEYFMKIITGAWSVDKFDEFVTKWKSSGGDKVLTAINTWYATFK